MCASSGKRVLWSSGITESPSIRRWWIGKISSGGTWRVSRPRPRDRTRPLTKARNHKKLGMKFFFDIVDDDDVVLALVVAGCVILARLRSRVLRCAFRFLTPKRSLSESPPEVSLDSSVVGVDDDIFVIVDDRFLPVIGAGSCVRDLSLLRLPPNARFGEECIVLDRRVGAPRSSLSSSSRSTATEVRRRGGDDEKIDGRREESGTSLDLAPNPAAVRVELGKEPILSKRATRFRGLAIRVYSDVPLSALSGATSSSESEPSSLLPAFRIAASCFLSKSALSRFFSTSRDMPPTTGREIWLMTVAFWDLAASFSRRYSAAWRCAVNCRAVSRSSSSTMW